MELERLRQVEQIFHAALEVEQNRRADFLRQACGNDESLLREVESLLAYFSKADSFIEQPAMELAAQELAWGEARGPRTTKAHLAGRNSLGGAWTPASIGHYRILRVLGEGGMGVVYEAEQERPRRTVALKVIKPGLASPELLRRFEQESRALARLQHPGIAQIYEAGTADSGFGLQPYFAMELVRGRSLRDYAEEHRLNTAQRLQLMVKICEAVQHAHQRGLIHRDLKPGNIVMDETGQPKILDFGVALVTDSDVETTRQTDLGQMVGTLAYMSPEQVLADPLEVDTRSDVYALGVILYELLAGRLPYDLSAQPHEAARTIREQDPARLSSISRLYRGDIETIVAKSLEKDKTRRYASASGLAADIHRYLNDEPISARPPSAGYQLRKFGRRHSALVVGVAAVSLVLVGGIVASSWEAARARRAGQAAIAERNRASTESATATAINEFLRKDLLAQASSNEQAKPDVRPDPDLKVRTALDRAASRIATKFAGQPAVEASIRQTIGNTYSDLGLYAGAELQLKRALDLRHQLLGEQHPDTLRCMNDLAVLYLNQDKLAQAEPLLTGILQSRRRVLGEEHADTAIAMNNLAILYAQQGTYPQSETLLVKVVAFERRSLGEEHPRTISDIGNLGAIYAYQGKYASAEPLFATVLDAMRRVSGEEHPDTLRSTINLAKCYTMLGNYPKAESLDAKAVEIIRRVNGTEHPATLRATAELGGVYRREGMYVRAKALLEQTLDTQRRVLGDEHQNTLATLDKVASLYESLGRYADSARMLEGVLRKRLKLGDDHPQTLDMMSHLGSLYLTQSQYHQAEAILDEALNSTLSIL